MLLYADGGTDVLCVLKVVLMLLCAEGGTDVVVC